MPLFFISLRKNAISLKCCFSEAKFTGDFPHVEHFRPKGRVDIIGSKTQLFPGYYWLAYGWSNLFLCKELINCSYKRNFFPLADESKRNRSHHDTNIEDNLIIDPSLENPREHIKFHNEEPTPITVKGRFNINFLGLRHASFVEDRRKRFAELQGLKNLVDIGVAYGYSLDDPLLSGSIATLRAAVEPDSEFSSMAIDLLQDWHHL
ncbi:MAG: hypothetical protein WKG06_36375 [Segetibacter sp.]